MTITEARKVEILNGVIMSLIQIKLSGLFTDKLESDVDEFMIAQLMKQMNAIELQEYSVAGNEEREYLSNVAVPNVAALKGGE